jgi:hypothetical protein
VYHVCNAACSSHVLLSSMTHISGALAALFVSVNNLGRCAERRWLVPRKVQGGGCALSGCDRICWVGGCGLMVAHTWVRTGMEC